MSDKRQLIVVDIETTGLDPSIHVPIEIAAINLDTGKKLHFAPALHPDDLGAAEGKALEINRYFERGVHERALSQDDTQNRYRLLFEMLKGNTLGGSNPRFDAEMLRHGYGRLSGSRGSYGRGQMTYTPADEVWHHRLADLSSYAAGVLGKDPTDLLGLEGVCKELGVANAAPHSALGDAEATAECFRTLAATKGGEQQ